MRRTNLKLRFISNTTKESKRLLIERLNNLGFSIRTEEIFTSLTAAKAVVLRDNIRPLLMLQPEAMEDFQGITVILTCSMLMLHNFVNILIDHSLSP